MVTFHDNTDGSYTLVTKQDVSPILEFNKAARNENVPIGDWVHAARIPMDIMMDLYKKGIRQDERAFRRWLDDRDNSGWRTHPMKVSK